MMRILKFGGKSLETLEKTQKICKNIKKIYKNDKQLIIVVSAMGNTTNNLIEMAEHFKPENNSKRELDALLSTGETLSSSIFAMALQSVGLPAKSFSGWQIKIKTYGDHQHSLISSIDKTKLEQCLKQNVIAVVAGFQGVNCDGDITTLGRGGSDTTAAALGAVFQTNVEIYSDFNGMFSGDPRNANFKKLNQVSLKQLSSVTKLGSKIVSNRAVNIAKNNNLSLILKSSSQPFLNGTVASGLEKENIIFVENDNLCEISIEIENSNKINFCAKNVFLLLKNYRLYNFSINFNKITILVNQSDKLEILNQLNKKLKFLKS